MNQITAKIKAPIAAEIEEFKQFFRNEFISLEPILGDVTEHLLSAEGKMLRPIIILLSAKLNGTINRKSYVAATAIETLHTATLVHDDVIDESDMRRGIASVQAQWSPQIAVLAGDYLLAKSLNVVAENGAYEMLPITTNVVKIISEGELFQLYKSQSLNINEAEYMNVIFKKTASLICACAQLGAMSVGAAKNTVDAMVEIGRNVGMAFQIRDDIFDYDSANISGKPFGNDLKENKLTLPIIYALKNADKNIADEIKTKIRKCRENTSFIEEIIDFAKRENGINYAEKQMCAFSDKAVELLMNFPKSDARESLIELAKYTATRKK